MSIRARVLQLLAHGQRYAAIVRALQPWRVRPGYVAEVISRLRRAGELPAQGPRPGQRCSQCGAPGHNRRTCPVQTRHE